MKSFDFPLCYNSIKLQCKLATKVSLWQTNCITSSIRFNYLEQTKVLKLELPKQGHIANSIDSVYKR